MRLDLILDGSSGDLVSSPSRPLIFEESFKWYFLAQIIDQTLLSHCEFAKINYCST